MTDKKYPKLTISLKKEDEASLLALRSMLEKHHKRQYSLADVVRHCVAQQISIQDRVEIYNGR